MRNYLLIIVTFFFVGISKQGKSQCASSVFSIPDSICPQQIVPINNSLSTANSFNWDFCVGDLDSLTTGVSLGNIGGALSFPQAMKMVEENGNYYGFICNVGAQYITRYDFGNSPNNTPTVTNLATNPILGGLATCIDMVKENNKWYAFAVLYSANTVIRMTLDSITDIDPDIVNLNVNTLSNPFFIKVIDGFAFVVNGGGPVVTRLSFNGSYSNNPTLLNPGINVGAFSLFGIDIAKDCLTNKYIGYVTNNSSGALFKLDFGTSLNNLPTITTSSSTAPAAQGLQIVKEANKWNVFIVSSSNVLYNFSAGNSLDNNLTSRYSTNLGGIMADPKNLQLIKKGTDWIGIMPNNFLGAVIRLNFPQGCKGTPQSSTLQSPSTINFSVADTGKVIFELKENNSNGSQSVFVDSIVVAISKPTAGFSASPACLGNSVQFTDTSKTCFGTINAWKWDFGDGATSTLQNPTHTYLTTGTFITSLKVFTNNNDSSSLSIPITVYDLPNANFTVLDSACVGATVLFNDASTSSSGTVNQWEWLFGDTNTGVGATTTHEYTNSGNFTITLIATTNFGCRDSAFDVISIKAGPLTNFVVNNTCTGETAIFTNLSTVSGTTISSNTWLFGDGNSATTQNASNTYSNNPASYTVQLTSIGANGCSNTFEKQVRIGNKPLVDFNLSQDTVCTFTNFDVIDNSVGGSGETIIKRIWDFGDGTLDSTNTQVSHSYSNPGTYTITLYVVNAEDCDSVLSKNIVVVGSPVASFNFTNECFGIANNFTDLSTAPSGSNLTDWTWSFGDNDSAFVSNTSHLYNNTGDYNVTLIVKTDIGCTNSITQQITVYDLPNVNFYFGNVCKNIPAKLFDSSTVINGTITNWTWNSSLTGSSSTLQNPLFTFPADLSYPIQLIVSSSFGCIDSLTKTLVVNAQNTCSQCAVPNFTVSDTICPLQPVNINNSQSNALSYNWDFCMGDLDSVPSGVALTNIGGALAFPQAMKLVEENGNYYSFFCNVGAQYITRYDFGNSPNNTPTATTLTSSTLLSGLATGIDMVKENNKWYAFVVLYSSNSLVRLTLDSITDNDPDISNLNISTLANPFYIKVINGYGFIVSGGSAEITRINFNGSYANNPVLATPGINVNAFSSFGIDIGFDCKINKYIGYVTNSASGALFKLDFGNNIANLPSVTLSNSTVPSAQGLQIVSEGNKWNVFVVSAANTLTNFSTGTSLDNNLNLLYTNNLGGILSDPKNLQLVKKGTEWIGIIPNNFLAAIVKVNFPQGCSGSAISSNQQSPSNIAFALSDTGNISFELTETLYNGTVQSFTDSINVSIQPPIAGFSNVQACIGSLIQFNDTSKICFGNITNWKWDLGDGTTSTLQNPTHIYNSAGNFNVSLKVYSNLNDSSIYSSVIKVSEPPTANFTVIDSVCVGTTVLINDASTSNDGVLSNWEWQFGDTNFGTGISTAHEYITSGNFTITLIATTNFGCSDTASKNIYIKPGPLTNFTVNNTCIGETTVFTDLSTVSGTTITNYNWSFGDGNFSTQQNTSNSYSLTPSSYVVELITKGANGCNDTLLKEIRIGNKPNAGFTLNTDTVCTLTDVFLTDSSFAGIGDTIIKRIWDFGDGSLDSTSLVVAHSYANPGLYTISLRVVSPEDCDSVVTKNVYVLDSPNADFSFTNVCYGLPNTFTDLSTVSSGLTLTNWIWSFGDGDSSTTNNNLHNYTAPGVYNVKLLVKNNLGCSDTVSKQVQVYSLPIANFTYGNVCTNTPIQFTDSTTTSSGTISNWLWDTGIPGGTSVSQNPLLTFPNDFVYAVQLIATTSFGCVDTATKFIIVNKSPEFTITSNDHCFGTSTIFQYNPAPGSSQNVAYLWTFGDNISSFIPTPTHQYLAPGTYFVNLQVNNLNNLCSGNKSDSIVVYPVPDASFSNQSVCVGQSVLINDQSTINNGTISNWKWTYNNTVSTNQNLAINSTTSGVYPIKLVVNSNFGCKDSTTGILTVNKLPEVDFTLTPSIGAPPLNIAFNNTSTTGIYNWNFGDNTTNSNLINPLHLYTDTGIYVISLTVTDTNGCTDSLKSNAFVINPRPDLAITGASYFKANNKWQMKANIANTGNEEANTFELKAQLDSKSVFIQQFDNVNLQPGEQREFKFKTTFEADLEKPKFFCVDVLTINNEADLNESNNNFCVTFSTSFEVLNIYPNPVSDQLYLGINMPIEDNIKLQLLDLEGRKITEEINYSLSKGYSTIKFEIGTLPAAVYLLRVKFSNKEKVYKIFKY